MNVLTLMVEIDPCTAEEAIALYNAAKGLHPSAKVDMHMRESLLELMAPAPAPAPAPVPAPVPVPAPAPAPASQEKVYTFTELSEAGSWLVDQGKMDDVMAVLSDKYKVQALTQLPESAYASFAADLRALGAKI